MKTKDTSISLRQSIATSHAHEHQRQQSTMTPHAHEIDLGFTLPIWDFQGEYTKGFSILPFKGCDKNVNGLRIVHCVIRFKRRTKYMNNFK